MAYPVPLRREVVGQVAQGRTKREVARAYRLPYPTVLQWCKRAEQGELAPRTPGPKKIVPGFSRGSAALAEPATAGRR